MRFARLMLKAVAVGAFVGLLAGVPASLLARNIPAHTEPAPVEVIHEDDPRWDCRVMGNRTCGTEGQTDAPASVAPRKPDTPASVVPRKPEPDVPVTVAPRKPEPDVPVTVAPRKPEPDVPDCVIPRKPAPDVPVTPIPRKF